MVIVRLKDGKKLTVSEAEYVVVAQGGRIRLLDAKRALIRELPWGDVVAYSTK